MPHPNLPLDNHEYVQRLESIALQAVIEDRRDARQRVADALKHIRHVRPKSGQGKDRARWFRGHIYLVGYPLKRDWDQEEEDWSNEDDA